MEPVRINVCYFKTNKDHFPHNFIFASDDESMDIWGLAEYEYPGMVKVTWEYTYLQIGIIISRQVYLQPILYFYKLDLSS